MTSVTQCPSGIHNPGTIIQLQLGWWLKFTTVPPGSGPPTWPGSFKIRQQIRFLALPLPGQGQQSSLLWTTTNDDHSCLTKSNRFMMTDMGGQRKRKKEMYYSGGTVEAPFEMHENLRPTCNSDTSKYQVTTCTFLLLLGSSFKY